ncbi:MAG: carbohydrate binding domain-containing protein [Deltaproteobacteria bacterium]|nr:carbohydrate binding domain-containing protein [Deltaproteobacteria bacterium]
MTFRVHSMGARFAASLAVSSLALFAGWLIVKPWLAQRRLSEPSSGEGLLRAISYDPRNPDWYYRLGLYRHYDPLGRDLTGAMSSYSTAINLSPFKSDYWLELSKVYEDLNDRAGLEKALNRALVLNPADPKARWRTVNYYLRQADTDGALEGLKLIIKDHPGERIKAFSLLHFITGNDVELIIKRALPGQPSRTAGGPEPMAEYLYFLMKRKDTEGAKTLWKALAAGKDMDPEARVAYIEYLISSGEMVDAEEEWRSYKGMAGKSANIVWNGGFEEDISNQGFDWRMEGVEGADADVDDRVSFKGKRSLRIEFDGKHNVAFYHAYQMVPLEPGTEYTLSAGMKTEDITTNSGIFIRLEGINGCNLSMRTETLIGTNAWKELKVGFTTPPDCTGGVVVLRRLRSEKLDNLIAGRAWVDEVRLEKSYAAAEQGVRGAGGPT